MIENGHYILEIPLALAEQYSEWTEAVAFRFVKHDDGSVEFQVSNDLELVTRPDGAQ